MAEPTSMDGQGWESFSADTVNAAGLQSVNVDVDADASIQTESNSSSTASADNVTGDSGAVLQQPSSRLQSASTVEVSADAGIQGLAGTTAASSASTSAGVANAFTTLADSAGIQDLTSLQVGGEMTALGQSMNSLSADAESVVGAAIGQTQLSEKLKD